MWFLVGQMCAQEDRKKRLKIWEGQLPVYPRLPILLSSVFAFYFFLPSSVCFSFLPEPAIMCKVYNSVFMECTCVDIHTYSYPHTHICVYEVHLHIYVHVYSVYTYTYTEYVYIHIRNMYMYTYTYIRKDTHTYEHIYTLSVYIHTHNLGWIWEVPTARVEAYHQHSAILGSSLSGSLPMVLTFQIPGARKVGFLTALSRVLSL